MNANNNTTVIGRLVADVEVKKTSGDVSTALFTVAVDRQRTKNNPEPGADFIRVKVWRGTADWLGRNIGKGTTLAVSGAIRVDRWQDQQGQQREMTYIDAEDVRVADNSAIKRPAGYVAPADRQQGQAPQGYAPAPQQYQQPQGYAPQAPQAPQGYIPQAPQGYAPAPQQYQQPQQPQYQPQQPQYQQPVPVPAPAPAPQQAFAPGPGYVPQQGQPVPYAGEGEFTPLPDEDLPF